MPKFSYFIFCDILSGNMPLNFISIHVYIKTAVGQVSAQYAENTRIFIFYMLACLNQIKSNLLKHSQRVITTKYDSYDS